MKGAEEGAKEAEAQLNLSRHCPWDHAILPTYPTNSAHVKSTCGRV
jgi:hypothetical protein